MKPPRFEYVRPTSTSEAVAALAEHGDEAKVLAGGQSLVPMLNMRLAAPKVVVDVNRLALAGIGEVNSVVRIEALVRQATLERSELVRERLPLLTECLPHVGHVGTRNRGTVGGSIAHADAKAELPLALLVHSGTAVVQGPRGLRSIPASDLFVTHYTTSIEPDELLVETLWPVPGPGSGAAFEELALRAGDYALAMAGCVLRVEGGRVAEARVAVGGPGERPTLSRAGAVITGWAVDESVARSAAEAAVEEVEPHDSLHASADYQRHLVGLMVERVVRRAWERAEAQDAPA